EADAQTRDDKRAAPKRMFSEHEFDGARLKKVDAELDFAAKKFHMASVPALQSLRVNARLAAGVLKLDPVDIGVAGGHVSGRLAFDGNRKPLVAHATAELKDVHIEQLLVGLSEKAKGDGPLRGRVDLKGRGDSVAAIAATATGPAEIELAGGGISN